VLLGPETKAARTVVPPGKAAATLLLVFLVVASSCYCNNCYVNSSF